MVAKTCRQQKLRRPACIRSTCRVHKFWGVVLGPGVCLDQGLVRDSILSGLVLEGVSRLDRLVGSFVWGDASGYYVLVFSVRSIWPEVPHRIMYRATLCLLFRGHYRLDFLISLPTKNRVISHGS